jgi:hypothetical protein
MRVALRADRAGVTVLKPISEVLDEIMISKKRSLLERGQGQYEEGG